MTVKLRATYTDNRNPLVEFSKRSHTQNLLLFPLLSSVPHAPELGGRHERLLICPCAGLWGAAILRLHSLQALFILLPPAALLLLLLLQVLWAIAGCSCFWCLC
jgi:hypothetical protein